MNFEEIYHRTHFLEYSYTIFSTGSVEYAESTSVEGYDPAPQ